jgi:formylglycine-generating enzyme required for sulfatase activity
MRKFIFIMLFCFTQTVGATAELIFSPLKPTYHVGEYIILDLQENLETSSRFEKVDLWVALQLPDESLLFRTMYPAIFFNPIPQPFRTGLEKTMHVHNILSFEVLEGLGGDYVFYALYVEEGKNPMTDGFLIQRSNLARTSTVLSNQFPSSTSEAGSSLTLPVIVTPPPAVAAPIAPAHLTAKAENAQITLTWQTMTEATSYSIYWRDAGGSEYTVSAATTPYTLKSLNNGTSYTFWVTALNSHTGLESIASASISAIPAPQVGDVFQDRLKDGDLGPEMVMIPAGTFRMGDIQGGGDSDEQPVHSVSVDAFAMGRYEVTFAEYDQFADAMGREKPDDEGWGRGNRPVIYVSWYDATAYAEWLSIQTGQQYRLPTEAEWEYAARAGTETKYWWGNWWVNEIGSNQANCSNSSCGESFEYTAPVGSFVANPYGLYDTAGNVWEWTCSEYESPYNGKENQCLSKNHASNDYSLSVRGGAWYDSGAEWMRSAFRNGNVPTYRNGGVGFRVAGL